MHTYPNKTHKSLATPVDMIVCWWLKLIQRQDVIWWSMDTKDWNLTVVLQEV